MRQAGSLAIGCLLLVVGALGCASGRPAGSQDPKLGGAASKASFPGYVSCNASLTNQTDQTLTITFVNSTPSAGEGWSAGFSPGYQINPGGTIKSSISDTPEECSASIGFESSGGGSFVAAFDNPWNSESTWGCSDITAAIECVIAGNEYGQPLDVTFTIVSTSK